MVSTGLGCDTGLGVLVSGRPRFRGVPGRAGRKLAVKVLGPLQGSADENTLNNEEEDV